MTKFSVHLCGTDNADGEYVPECRDVEINAESPTLAETYALARYPEFRAVRIQSVWNAQTKDWEET